MVVEIHLDETIGFHITKEGIEHLHWHNENLPWDKQVGYGIANDYCSMKLGDFMAVFGKYINKPDEPPIYSGTLRIRKSNVVIK